MNKTTLKMKMLYEDMGSAEKKVAGFLMQNPAAILPLSISDLAEKCDCGEATIVRFARRLGFEGYQDLKISLAQEENIKSVSDNIQDTDSPIEVFEKVINDIYCSLEKTKQVLNGDYLKGVCEAIQKSNKIVILGLGNSSSVAIDFSHKLLRLGLNAVAYTDNHMQAIAVSHLDENGFVIGISHSGSSKDIIEALKLAKLKNVKTAGITNFGKSPIVKYCDYILNTSADEVNYRILGLNSRIAQLAIIDSIYCYLVCHIENAMQAINETEEALNVKKF